MARIDELLARVTKSAKAQDEERRAFAAKSPPPLAPAPDLGPRAITAKSLVPEDPERPEGPATPSTSTLATDEMRKLQGPFTAASRIDEVIVELERALHVVEDGHDVTFIVDKLSSRSTICGVTSTQRSQGRRGKTGDREVSSQRGRSRSRVHGYGQSDTMRFSKPLALACLSSFAVACASVEPAGPTAAATAAPLRLPTQATTTLNAYDPIGIEAPALCSVANPIGCAPSEARLLIVGPAWYSPAMNRLLAHKRAIGTSAFVITMEDVRKYSGRDDAERLKTVIRRMHETKGTWYVLLAGDASVVPVRRRAVGLYPTYNPQEYPFDTSYNVSDLYYSNLYHHTGPRAGQFDNWDANGNGKFDEQMWEDKAATNNPDDVDGYPDVAVGRVPANPFRGRDEFGIFVDKVIRYETGVARYANGIDRAAFIADGNFGESIPMLERMEQATLLAGRTAHLGMNFAPGTLPSGWFSGGFADIASLVGMSPWVSYTGHGFREGWAVRDGGYAYGGYAVETLYNAKLPIVFAAACDTGKFASNVPYDQYYDDAGVIHQFEVDFTTRTATDVMHDKKYDLPFTTPTPGVYDGTSTPGGGFSRDWLFNEHGGAVAYFGENVVKPATFAMELQTDMLLSYGKGYRVLGDVWADGARKYYSDNVSNDYVFAHPRIYLGIMQMFGDPSLRLQ